MGESEKAYLRWFSQEGVIAYTAYMGTCPWTGYGFWSLCPEQGIQLYENPS